MEKLRAKLGFLAAVAAITVAASSRSTGTAGARNVAIPSNQATRALLKNAYGYSIEPIWLDDYISSSVANTLLSAITSTTGGTAPPIRVGGNTADVTFIYPTGSVNYTSTVASNGHFYITPAWFDTWSDYFPQGTELLYSINFADTSSNWANGIAQTKAAYESFGSKLFRIELGNEIDHFISSGFRSWGWDIAQYVSQWRTVTNQIVQSSWYQRAGKPFKFQAASFADPPWVPDQQDELDDFDIINLTAAGLTDQNLIGDYAVHLYPQSTCDTGRWYRMSLDLLSNHDVLWHNVSQYVPQVAAADGVGIPLVLGETNSVSCSGRSGISDTFGAALWAVDYVLMAASIGIPKVYFHLGAHSQYSAFTPLGYTFDSGQGDPTQYLTAGVRANFYSHYFTALAVKGCPDGTGCTIGALKDANASDFSGYAIYDGQKNLSKMVFLDMGVWNSSTGLSNPSTLSSTDSKSVSAGKRPVHSVSVTTSWAQGTALTLYRLQGPGTNAKDVTAVNVSGVTFDVDGMHGTLKGEEMTVGAGGKVDFDLKKAEAVLVVKG